MAGFHAILDRASVKDKINVFQRRKSETVNVPRNPAAVSGSGYKTSHGKDTATPSSRLNFFSSLGKTPTQGHRKSESVGPDVDAHTNATASKSARRKKEPFDYDELCRKLETVRLYREILEQETQFGDDFKKGCILEEEENGRSMDSSLFGEAQLNETRERRRRSYLSHQRSASTKEVRKLADEDKEIINKTKTLKKSKSGVLNSSSTRFVSLEETVKEPLPQINDDKLHSIKELLSVKPLDIRADSPTAVDQKTVFPAPLLSNDDTPSHRGSISTVHSGRTAGRAPHKYVLMPPGSAPKSLSGSIKKRTASSRSLTTETFVSSVNAAQQTAEETKHQLFETRTQPSNHQSQIGTAASSPQKNRLSRMSSHQGPDPLCSNNVLPHESATQEEIRKEAIKRISVCRNVGEFSTIRDSITLLGQPPSEPAPEPAALDLPSISSRPVTRHGNKGKLPKYAKSVDDLRKLAVDELGLDPELMRSSANIKSTKQPAPVTGELFPPIPPMPALPAGTKKAEVAPAETPKRGRRMSRVSRFFKMPRLKSKASCPALTSKDISGVKEVLFDPFMLQPSIPLGEISYNDRPAKPQPSELESAPVCTGQTIKAELAAPELPMPCSLEEGKGNGNKDAIENWSFGYNNGLTEIESPKKTEMSSNDLIASRCASVYSNGPSVYAGNYETGSIKSENQSPSKHKRHSSIRYSQNDESIAALAGIGREEESTSRVIAWKRGVDTLQEIAERSRGSSLDIQTGVSTSNHPQPMAISDLEVVKQPKAEPKEAIEEHHSEGSIEEARPTLPIPREKSVNKKNSFLSLRRLTKTRSFLFDRQPPIISDHVEKDEQKFIESERKTSVEMANEQAIEQAWAMLRDDEDEVEPQPAVCKEQSVKVRPPSTFFKQRTSFFLPFRKSRSFSGLRPASTFPVGAPELPADALSKIEKSTEKAVTPRQGHMEAKYGTGEPAVRVTQECSALFQEQLERLRERKQDDDRNGRTDPELEKDLYSLEQLIQRSVSVREDAHSSKSPLSIITTIAPPSLVADNSSVDPSTAGASPAGLVRPDAELLGSNLKFSPRPDSAVASANSAWSSARDSHSVFSSPNIVQTGVHSVLGKVGQLETVPSSLRPGTPSSVTKVSSSAIDLRAEYKAGSRDDKLHLVNSTEINRPQSSWVPNESPKAIEDVARPVTSVGLATPTITQTEVPPLPPMPTSDEVNQAVLSGRTVRKCVSFNPSSLADGARPHSAYPSTTAAVEGSFSESRATVGATKGRRLRGPQQEAVPARLRGSASMVSLKNRDSRNKRASLGSDSTRRRPLSRLASWGKGCIDFLRSGSAKSAPNQK